MSQARRMGIPVAAGRAEGLPIFLPSASLGQICMVGSEPGWRAIQQQGLVKWIHKVGNDVAVKMMM